MCSFIFHYENNTEHPFEHIKRITYSRAGSRVTVDEKDLLTHSFPTGTDLHLFSDTSNFTVSGKNLVYIEVRKES